MMKITAIALLLALSGCVATTHPHFSRLSSTLDDAYPIWKINGTLVNTNGGFDILFSETHPKEVSIPDWEEVLNGTSWRLLACHGHVLKTGDLGFVVGTAVEGPTHGRLLVYNEKLELVGSVSCQKVVRMKLVDLLKDGVEEVVTWEDHHYGTCTTRRRFNVYKLDAQSVPQMVFTHDLVDATFMPGGPNGVKRKLYYKIDINSKDRQKQIVVTSDEGEETLYSWNGTEYNTANNAIDGD